MSTLRLNEILNRLNGVKSVGREHYLALCPCHDDHRPSLDIAVKNNKILMCCPVCGADGVKVMQTLGLNARDLFDDSKRERPERPASVDYYYSDKLKKTRFYVWDDKTQGWSKSFCWYHKGERGQQVKGLPKDSDGRSLSYMRRRKIKICTHARKAGSIKALHALFQLPPHPSIFRQTSNISIFIRPMKM